MKIKNLAFIILSLPIYIYSQADLKELEILPENIQKAIEERDRIVETELPPEIEELISSSVVAKSKIWNESVLKVSFKGGNSTLHRLIAQTANIWTKYGDLTFDFGYNPIKRTFRTWKPNDSSDIRIGFGYKGYWSLIGNTSIDWSIIPKGQISLNLGKFDNGRLPTDWKATVLHEFGHALGFKHEHQSPDIDCDFDWPKVYAELAKEPNKWSKKKVNHNIKKLQERGLVFTDYDKKSIMHYSFPAWMFKSGLESKCYTTKNAELSRLDKKIMSRIYPQNKTEYLSQRKNLAVVYLKASSVDSTNMANSFYREKSEYFSKERIANSKYIIGLQGLRVDKEKYKRFSSYIIDKGYTINLNSNYEENRPWLATVSIVLYYSRENRRKAKEIASELSEVTGQKFEIGIGKGLAVFDPTKQFYVHWIPNN